MTELDAALEAARAAARLLRDDARPARVESKAEAVDLVTEVDRACEDAVREVLARRTPGIPVLGEERGGGATSGALWVVDPIDGTTNFVHGFPFYAVSVGLQVDGRSEVGVIVDPLRNLEYTAERGRGAHRNGAPLRVSGVRDLSKALFGTGFPPDRQKRAAFYLKYVQAALERGQGVRRAGACSLDLCMVAQGGLDAYWEFHLKRWDVAAGMLIVEEAGGVVTSHDGGPLSLEDPCPLATNGHLHEAMIALLASVEP